MPSCCEGRLLRELAQIAEVVAAETTDVHRGDDEKVSGALQDRLAGSKFCRLAYTHHPLKDLGALSAAGVAYATCRGVRRFPTAVVWCVREGAGFVGRGAMGVLTHLGLGVCRCDENYKNGPKTEAQHGVIFTRDARLSLSLP